MGSYCLQCVNFCADQCLGYECLWSGPVNIFYVYHRNTKKTSSQVAPHDVKTELVEDDVNIKARKDLWRCPEYLSGLTTELTKEGASNWRNPFVFSLTFSKIQKEGRHIVVSTFPSVHLLHVGFV